MILTRWNKHRNDEMSNARRPRNLPNIFYNPNFHFTVIINFNKIYYYNGFDYVAGKHA